MKQLAVGTKKLSRQQLANPSLGKSVKQRLETKHAVNLENNSRLIAFGNGYGKRVAIDNSKTY